MDDPYRPGGSTVVIAPLAHGRQDRPQIAAAVGEAVVVPGRVIRVRRLDQHAGFDQPREPVLERVPGNPDVTAGLAFLPMIGGLLVSANISSTVLLPRIGPRALIPTGMLLGAAAIGYLTQIGVTSSYAGSVLPALIVLGLGFGMVLAPAINTATAGVQRQDSGVAAALVNTMQQVGGSIGAAALSTIALTATAHYLAGHRDGGSPQPGLTRQYWWLCHTGSTAEASRPSGRTSVRGSPSLSATLTGPGPGPC
jgi:hypothetical protein